jgi:choline dehydrogenase-like flavoprotein
MLEIYDFIIVGGEHFLSFRYNRILLNSHQKGGTAGCLLASRLAKATAKPSVLLLEAGGDNKNLLPQAPADRYLPVFTRPELQHGYFTTRQETFNGKELTYCRGKGLGGSSVINFMGYYYGPSAEYERWAELVGDDAWGWENVRDRFKRVRTCEVAHILQGISHLLEDL